MKRCVYCNRPPAYWWKRCVTGTIHRFPLSAFEVLMLERWRNGWRADKHTRVNS